MKKIKRFLTLTLDEYALLLIGMGRPYAGKFANIFHESYTKCETFKPPIFQLLILYLI